MTDWRIENTNGIWDLVLKNGDWDLFDDSDPTEFAEGVGQVVVYTLMTWFGESVYDPVAGQPHADVLGSLEPIEGIAGIYALAIQESPGVAELTAFEFDEIDDAGQFDIRATFKAGAIPVSIGVQVG